MGGLVFLDSLGFRNIYPIFKKTIAHFNAHRHTRPTKKGPRFCIHLMIILTLCVFFGLPELHFRSEVFLTKNTNLEAMNKPAMGQIIW